jgi:hypothetical protein
LPEKHLQTRIRVATVLRRQHPTGTEQCCTAFTSTGVGSGAQRGSERGRTMPELVTIIIKFAPEYTRMTRKEGGSIAGKTT